MYRENSKRIAVSMLSLTAATFLSTRAVRATETENYGLRLLPAPAGIKIDGKADDWNLAGGVFASSNVEDLSLRNNLSLWVHGAYDANNLYILARFNDNTPLNNAGDSKLDFAWGGDSIQVRVITNYGQPNEQDSVANAWKGVDGRDVVELDTAGFTKNSPKGDDIKPLGAQQAFQVRPDGKGYNQEIAIPWKFLGKDGYIPKTGDSIILTVEPNFSFGANQTRVSIKDIFRPGVPIDRVFTFMSKGSWGVAPLLPPGPVPPQPLRLSDGRTFPLGMENGEPVVNWSGLVKTQEAPGFKPIEFTLPDDGYVSLIIKNGQGEVVRHLLNAAYRAKGENTISWDGLGEPSWKTPGQPVAPGNYWWSALYHHGIGLKLRGFADNSGMVPWDNGKGSNWGGDMAPPESVATDGDKVLLGWGVSEAGKAAVLTDLDGKPLWSHKRGGFGGAPFVGLDGGIAYIVDHATIYKLREADSVVVPWEATGAGELNFPELFAGEAALPKEPSGAAFKNGRTYLSSSSPTNGFVAIVDAKTGRLERKVALAGAGKLTATINGVYTLVGGTSVVFIDAATGAAKTVLKDISGARALAVDTAGNFYVGVGAPDQQIKVYAPTGRLLRTIGRKGGRPTIGLWQADALLNVASLTIDSRNQLWVAESAMMPQRFSVWNATTGKLLHEFFGPTRYGASGGAIHPANPDVMVGECCEWKLDPVTGRATCVGIIDTEFHAFARFAKTGNGRDYLAVEVPSFIGGDWGRPTGIKIFERLSPGRYKLRSTIFEMGADAAQNKTERTEFWADRNDDQKVQPDEVTSIPHGLQTSGYYHWSMYMNADLTFYGSASHEGTDPSLQVKVAAYTPCGAPIYDVAGAKPLPGNGGLSSLDNKFLMAHDGGNSPDWALYDLSKGQRVWGYPDLWMGVHGSHNAPPPEAGLLRGTFGIVGSAKLPEPVGDIWALNSNVGEWHLLTRDGFYLSRLFQPDSMKVVFPAEAKPGADITEAPSGMGGEDFGGSLVQGNDGKVYVEAGKTGLWNAEVTGLDTIRSLGGSQLSISDADVKTAQGLREGLLQQAVGPHSLDVKKLTPTFTGDLDADFKGASVVSYQKGDETGVRSALAWDDQNLYAAWEVKDPTPWINNATAPDYMYAHGDTVDLQLGTDATADKGRAEAVLGDLRLSIGKFGDKPTAVIYRRVATDKASKTFSSGIVHEYIMQNVKTLPDARIQVKVDAPGKRYIVEAAIPLRSLGLNPVDGQVLRGDLGATHSDPGGEDTRLRSYWSNQETGIVDDEVYELMMQPKNWGDFNFKN